MSAVAHVEAMWKHRSPKVLLSYRRADTSAVAGHLAEKLKQAFGRDRVFIDVDNIPFGADFREHIRATMAECDIVIALIGHDWTGGETRRIDDPSDYLRIEIETALQLGVRLIPVLVDSAAMPKASGLPASLERLAYLNAAPLSVGRDFNMHAARIVEAIKRHQGESWKRPGEAATATGPTGPPARRAERALPALPGAAVAITEWGISLFALWAWANLIGSLLSPFGGASDTVYLLAVVTAGSSLLAANALVTSRTGWRIGGWTVAVVNLIPVVVIVYGYFRQLNAFYDFIILCYASLRIPGLCFWVGRDAWIHRTVQAWRNGRGATAPAVPRAPRAAAEPG